MNGPATSLLAYHVSWPGAAANNHSVIFTNGWDTGGGSVSTGSPAAASNIAMIFGVFTASASGTVVVRNQAESGGTITAKAGSTLEWW
jgi:hypothetical protein